MPWSRAHRPAADPGLTSRHLPASLEIGSDAQFRLFKALAGRVKTDSTRHWEISGGRLRISYDLLQDLTGGNLPNTGGGLGDRFSSFLARDHGIEFRSGGTAHGTYLPNDKWLQAPQWALKNPGTTLGNRPGKAGVDIDIERVWDKFGGSDSLVIAVVDAGFDFNHPDLKGRNWINRAEADGKPGADDDNNGYVDDSLGWDFVDNDNLPQDYHGHGTFTSSAIAAGFDNGEGIAGALAQAKIMPIRVLDASGHGDESRIAKGILYAVKNGAKAVNFSIGGDGDNPALRSAFQAARDAGVPIIVAAGNDTHDLNVTPAYPASYNYDNMLVVAAHDHAGLLCAFSNYGKTAVHLAAPGEFILVAGLPDPKEAWKDDFESGTLRWSAAASEFALSNASPVDGAQSLAWVSGNNVSATAPDTIDLTGVKGATIRFRMDFKPAYNNVDVVIVEANKIGTAIWTEIAVIPISTGDLVQAYGLQDLDGSRFKLRFRTSLNTRFSATGRALRIDDVVVAKPDPDPPKEPVYTVTGGTSLAAPYVTAYVGLQRLACDRMGLPWTRARALAGVADDPDLAGKVATNGRLDVYKGLEFYLSTLPDFRVADSTVSVWTEGRKVQYALSLSPAPEQAYAFSGGDLPPGAAIDGAGMLTWNPTADQVGEYTVRLFATGPTVLRKALTFSVRQELPVAIRSEAPGLAAASGVAPAAWRWGGQSFRLRPGLTEGRHLVEVFGTDAAGKVRLLKRDWMDSRAFLQAQGTPRPDAAVIKRLQIRVDGIFLAPGA
jgi:hypothetical protein